MPDCKLDVTGSPAIRSTVLLERLPAAFYKDEWVTLYHGDAREIVPLLKADTLVTDPPYPNNAGHFDADIPAACDVLRAWKGGEAMVFWWEMDNPPMQLPHVATHIWHRNNVNGRPYEPVYHYAPDGVKRRSNVKTYWAIKEGIGPADKEYQGHPTQKPIAVMEWVISMMKPPTLILDPFCGVGATLRAAKNLRICAIGIEKDERYCETTARRMAQGILAL
jgi:site-specific DNA-methyltransferase (adenine-specific)